MVLRATLRAMLRVISVTWYVSQGTQKLPTSFNFKPSRIIICVCLALHDLPSMHRPRRHRSCLLVPYNPPFLFNKLSKSLVYSYKIHIAAFEEHVVS